MGKTQRNSSIELLKVVAVAMIVLSHAAAGGIEYILGLPSRVATAEIVNFGQIGNCLFFIASAWFLCLSDKVKPVKAVKLVTEGILTSILCAAIVLLLGYQLTKSEIILSSFPITYGYNWFVSCYLLIYLIHPYLNAVISSMKREQHFALISLMIVIYGCISVPLGGGKYYYTELIGFIIIYFITAYLKLYHHDVKSLTLLKWFVFGFVAWQISTIAICIGGKPLWLNKFVNPCFMMIAFPLFLFVTEYHFTSKVINWLSSLSLMVYMLHNNKLVREVVETDFFQRMCEDATNVTVYMAIILWFGITLLLSIALGGILHILFSFSPFERTYNSITEGVENSINRLYKKTL